MKHPHKGRTYATWALQAKKLHQSSWRNDYNQIKSNDKISVKQKWTDGTHG